MLVTMTNAFILQLFPFLEAVTVPQCRLAIYVDVSLFRLNSNGLAS